MAAAGGWQDQARRALAHYPLAVQALEPIDQGLVNLTLALTAADGTRFVLQRLHPVFGPEVNANLAAVTAHLAARGLVTPRLVPAADGAPAVEVAGRWWRVLTFVRGRAHDRMPDARHAAAAGAGLARFHLALADFAAPLVASRPPVHDYPRHRAKLAQCLVDHRGHRLAPAVASLAATLDGARTGSAAVPAAPTRVVHGDPKLSNLLFAEDGVAVVCLIDLDTLARMPLALELGDAFRSWCNPAGEDAVDARFDLGIFAAALAGYAGAAAGFVRPEEIAGIVPATLLIHHELAARFLADALEEAYFGWDRARYPAAGEHHLARARAQLAAAASLAGQRSAAEQAVAEAFGRALS